MFVSTDVKECPSLLEFFSSAFQTQSSLKGCANVNSYLNNYNTKDLVLSSL